MLHILIADDVLVTSNILAAVVDAADDMTVLGQTDALGRVREVVRDEAVDVVVVSAVMPNGFDMVRAVKSEDTAVNVVVLGVPPSLDHILAFIECGADGYVLAGEHSAVVLQTLRTVAAGGVEAGSDVVKALMRRVKELSTFCEEIASDRNLSELTRRERDVLRQVATNRTNAEIADQLEISVGTVKTHVHNILSKLDVSSRHEAARFVPLLDVPQRSIGDLGGALD